MKIKELPKLELINTLKVRNLYLQEDGYILKIGYVDTTFQVSVFCDEEWRPMMYAGGRNISHTKLIENHGTDTIYVLEEYQFNKGEYNVIQ